MIAIRIGTPSVNSEASNTSFSLTVRHSAYLNRSNMRPPYSIDSSRVYKHEYQTILLILLHNDSPNEQNIVDCLHLYYIYYC